MHWETSSFQSDEEHLADFEALKGKTPPLKLPTNNQGTTKLFHFHKAQSVHESLVLQKVIHLHPEFVFASSNKDLTVFCPSCSKFFQQSQKLEKQKPMKTNSSKINMRFMCASKLHGSRC